MDDLTNVDNEMSHEKKMLFWACFVVVFPIIMLICYIFLIFYIKRKDGYKVVDLQEA